VVDERRSLGLFGARLDLVPQIFQEADVGAEILFRGSGRGRADNESALAVFALADDNAFSRWRSSSEEIFRDTPVWFTVGMYTRKRPGSAMWL